MKQGTKAVLAIAICALTVSVAVAAADEIPSGSTDGVSEVGYTTAHLTGTVNPFERLTYYGFEYSTDQVNWTRGPSAYYAGNPTVPAKSGPTQVSEELTGLKGGTKYFVRIGTYDEVEFTEHFSEPPYLSFTTDPVASPAVSIDPVSAVTGTSAHFSGRIDPEAPAGNPGAFDVNWEFKCTPECPGLAGGTVTAAEGEQEVEADATGLEPNTDYEVELLASNVGGSSAEAGPESFTTDAVAPVVETIPAFSLEGGTAALVGGRINPKNSATTYWIEYGTNASYGSSAPASEDAEAGSGGQAQVVTQELTGLTPGSEYHFRIVAESASGETDGEDMTFTTPALAGSPPPCPNAELRTGAGAELPDCRAYELVSAPDLLGASASAIPSPEGIRAWGAVASNGERVLWDTTGVLPGVDSSGTRDTFLSTRGSDGWNLELASPPGSKFTPGAPFLLYGTPNLERMLWRIPGAQLDPADTDPVDPTAPGTYNSTYRREPDGSFVWLSRGSDIHPASSENPIFAGSSLDALKVFFGDSRQLEPDAPNGGLYERFGQTTSLIDKDENGDSLSGKGKAVSDDGSVVAFTDNSGALYIHEEGQEQAISVAAGGSSGARVEGISRDGSRVFFISDLPLVAEDADSARDLYEYDVLTRSLKRISAPAASTTAADVGNGPQDAEGVTVDADGDRVYFVSPELMDGGRGVDGQKNLYLYEAGQIHYLTTLDPSDPDFGEAPGSSSEQLNRHVRLTPDQATLLFESRARITSYDNAGHVEIYAYDATADLLSCVSCRPGGAPPVGDSLLQHLPEQVSGEQIPDGAGQTSQEPIYLANSDQHGERFFFHTADALVPRDRNGKSDVYEYDARTGTPALISSGTSSGNSIYYGNSSDGRDVFFFTTDSLTSKDRNGGAFKVYDARVDGGFSSELPPAPCRADGCQGEPTQPPPFTSPSSSAISHPRGHRPRPRHCHPKRAKAKHRHCGKGKHRTPREHHGAKAKGGK